MIPKILHLYWGKNKPLSWLRYMTVKSFSILNPDWEINVWYPQLPNDIITWQTNEQKLNLIKDDWFDELEKVGKNVRLKEAPINDFPLLSEVHRSDLLRWRLLHTIGGFWSDFDILYFKSMDILKMDYNKEALLCWGEIEDLKTWQAIGFLAGKEGSDLFFQMEKLGLLLATAPNLSYQDLGTDLLNRFIKAGQKSIYNIGQIPQHSVYPFSSLRSQKDSIWNNFKYLDVKENTVGLHWFAGQKLSAKMESHIIGLKSLKEAMIHSGIGWVFQQLPIDIPDVGKSLSIKYTFIIPYIDRYIQFKNTLISYWHWYMDRIDWEVIIIKDSKCKEDNNFQDLISHWIIRGMRIKMVESLKSNNTYNPSALYNQGVKNASGEYVVLTSPEIFHEVDILTGFDNEFENMPDSYLICACQNRLSPRHFIDVKVHSDLRGRLDKWYQHSIYRPSLYHFCSAIKKDIYESIGGFDKRFMDGYCFDDDDFRDTIQAANIKIIQLDDLLTYHQEHNSIEIPEKMIKWQRNKDLYESKHKKEYLHIKPMEVVNGR